MIVEDDPWLAEEWTRRLKNEGYKIIYARHGIEAMDKIDTADLQCIILDMFLPGPNGLVFLHELKSHADLAQIPVIMCTNSAHLFNEKDLWPYGVSKLLDKSTMDPQDLLLAIKRLAL